MYSLLQLKTLKQQQQQQKYWNIDNLSNFLETFLQTFPSLIFTIDRKVNKDYTREIAEITKHF